jgi:hypothetical protein
MIGVPGRFGNTYNDWSSNEIRKLKEKMDRHADLEPAQKK